MFFIVVTAGNIKIKIKTYLNNLIQNRLKSNKIQTIAKGNLFVS